MSDDAAASLPSPSSNAASNATPVHTPSPTSDTPVTSFSRPSSSRVINPAPITTRVTPKVAIATASSPPLDYAHPSPVGGGPTSTSYVVPPRPKPGRKPATDEPASKRKAQNRESQRAFRARKAAKLTEMQTQVESTEHRHRQEMSEKVMEINDKELRIAQLESVCAQLKEAEKRTAQERDFWKEQAARFDDLLKQLKERRGSMTSWGDKHSAFFQARLPNSRQDSPTRDSLSVFTPLATTPQAYDTPKTVDIGCGNCKPGGPCACMEEMAKLSTTTAFTAAVPLAHTPTRTSTSPMKGMRVGSFQTSPEDAAKYAEMEIDFTTQFANRRTRLDTRPSIAFLTQTNEADSKCGFCTDDSNCLCRDASLQEIQRPNDEMAPPTQIVTPNETRPTSNNRTTSGPGTCADCMRDPKQRAWCQRVAQLRGSASDYFSASPASRSSSISSGLDPMEPSRDYAPVPDREMPNRYSIGCSDAYRLFDGRVPTDPDSMDWSTLKPITPSASRSDSLPGLNASRKYSALELDTAGVIATLQQTMGPLTPRKEDGAHADLVRIAQEHQKSTDSPR